MQIEVFSGVNKFDWPRQSESYIPANPPQAEIDQFLCVEVDLQDSQSNNVIIQSPGATVMQVLY